MRRLQPITVDDDPAWPAAATAGPAPAWDAMTELNTCCLWPEKLPHSLLLSHIFFQRTSQGLVQYSWKSVGPMHCNAGASWEDLPLPREGRRGVLTPQLRLHGFDGWIEVPLSHVRGHSGLRWIFPAFLCMCDGRSLLIFFIKIQNSVWCCSLC